MHPQRKANPNAKRPEHADDRYDALISAAWDAGWWCVRGRKNYIKCYPPDDNRMVVVPSTPSGKRTLPNKRGQFRRSGLDV